MLYYCKYDEIEYALTILCKFPLCKKKLKAVIYLFVQNYRIIQGSSNHKKLYNILLKLFLESDVRYSNQFLKYAEKNQENVCY